MMKAILVSASALALVATAAVAEGTAGKTTPQYKPDAAAAAPASVDTRADVQKLAEAQFLAADVNVDGALDLKEFVALSTDAAKQADATKPTDDMAALAPTAEEAFKDIAKADSEITRQELVDARARSFDAADTNNNAKLDESEQQRFAALTAVKPQAPEKTAPPIQ